MKATDKITREPAILGESAMWDYRTQKLLWVDIEGKKIHEYDPSRNEDIPYMVPRKPGTIVLTEQKDILVAALENVFSYVSLGCGKVEDINGPEDIGGLPVRLNDGKCDAAGRLWIGTIDIKDYSKPIASLYRYEANGICTKMKDGFTISNGIAWSLDGTKMYHIDSPLRTVVEYVFDNASGTIDSPRVVIRTPVDLGTPDGSTLDEEGMLWIAHWGGACVTRWDPATGQMLMKIDVPAKHVTSVAFGGKDLDILYITTARNAMTPEEAKTYPDAGHVFMCRPGVRGIKANIFK